MGITKMIIRRRTCEQWMQVPGYGHVVGFETWWTIYLDISYTYIIIYIYIPCYTINHGARTRTWFIKLHCNWSNKVQFFRTFADRTFHFWSLSLEDLNQAAGDQRILWVAELLLFQPQTAEKSYLLVGCLQNKGDLPEKNHGVKHHSHSPNSNCHKLWY